MKRFISIVLLLLFPSIALGDQIVVVKKSASIRAEAIGQSTIIKVVHDGDVLQLAYPSKEGHYYHVIVDNHSGYIYQTSVRVSSGTTSDLSNNNYYTNVDGNRVHSPAYSNDVPEGACALCNDGTYSFSQHRRGTCSHHGGVARWLR